jgi:Rieske 2Fe-2S family protein
MVVDGGTGSALLTAAEIAAVRRPYRSATQLPPRVFHDPAIFAFEQQRWFAREWLCVGRVEDAAEPGAYFLAEPAGESVIVVRGAGSELRAFYNVCRHRGSRLLEESCGAVAKIHCPYHAWIYDLDGSLRTARHTDGLTGFDRARYGLAPVRCETCQGFVFVSLDPQAQPLATAIGDLAEHLARFDLGALRRARTMTYDVAANWKVIGENFSECYHCPGVHPQLNKLSRYDTGADFATEGPWKGGYMDLSAGAETLSMSGRASGRPALPGMTADDTRRVHYYLLWPNLLLSLHPDYLLTHRILPVEPGRSTVHCDWYFPPGASGVDDVVDFWDLTNRQDWHVCALQQRGTASRGYTPGRYSEQEDAVHAFDLMCVDRYAMDGVTSRRDSRLAGGALVPATN